MNLCFLTIVYTLNNLVSSMERPRAAQESVGVRSRLRTRPLGPLPRRTARAPREKAYFLLLIVREQAVSSRGLAGSPSETQRFLQTRYFCLEKYKKGANDKGEFIWEGVVYLYLVMCMLGFTASSSDCVFFLYPHTLSATNHCHLSANMSLFCLSYCSRR